MHVTKCFSEQSVLTSPRKRRVLAHDDYSLTTVASAPSPNRKQYLVRSLLIWAAETELMLTKRVQPTHQQAATHRDNLIELDKLARIRRLYSDPELCAEVEPLRPVVSYTADGSHKMKYTYADILTPYNDLADKGEGAGGIVLMPGEDSYLNPLPCGIPVVTNSWDERLHLRTRHTACCHLHDEINTTRLLQGYTDFTGMSAMVQTNNSLRTYKVKLCTKDTDLLASSMRKFTSVTAPRQLLHIKGHPAGRPPAQGPWQLQTPLPTETPRRSLAPTP
jgi:hypothetical protein